MPYITMTDKTKIYYEDKGKGETLIFAHGLNSSHNPNKDFHDEFKNFRIITYDQRGHANSDKSTKHMTIKHLGQDLNEIIENLNLNKITLIGHSMGAATIYSYINQFGCEKLKRIVASDMSPYMRNNEWKGGIGQGNWSDEDFLMDFDRIFDDVGKATFHIAKKLMNPELSNISNQMKETIIKNYNEEIDPFTMASLWFSLFKTDQRPAIKKINIPFLYIMPEKALYSMEAIDFIENNVQKEFILANSFPNTTHAIWREMPHEVANCIKKFINKY